MNPKRIAILAGLLAALAASALYAQAGAFMPGAPTVGTYNVYFTSNVNKAVVYINGQYAQTTSFTTKLRSGSYQIRVTAPGYQDWNQNINVNGNMTVNAVLQSNQPANYSLNVSSNVNGAVVYIDGAQVSGGTPVRVTLTPGQHSIRVSADGYLDWTGSINLDRDSSIRAELRERRHALRILSNVPGAHVEISGAPNGSTPYETDAPRGNYTITVTSPGYLPFSTTVTMNDDQTVNAVLQLALATVRLSIPDQFLNPYVKDQYNRIEWYVDGARATAGSGDNQILVQPGQHSIRVVSGGLSVEGRYNLQPGQLYTLEPELQLRVHQ